MREGTATAEARTEVLEPEAKRGRGAEEHSTEAAPRSGAAADAGDAAAASDSSLGDTLLLYGTVSL